MVGKRGLFICFAGIDGSGKTTLANALISSLEESDVRSIYVWNRFEPLLMKPIVTVAKAIFFRGKDYHKNYEGHTKTKKRLFANLLISTTYQYFLFFDYIFQIFVRISIPLGLGKNIVCDRCVYDTVIDMVVDLNYSDKKIKSMLKNFSYFLPKPDITFLVDVPEEIAYQRKKDTPSVNYLRERREMYLDMGKEYRMVILDGSKKLEELQCEMEKKVFQ